MGLTEHADSKWKWQYLTTNFVRGLFDKIYYILVIELHWHTRVLTDLVTMENSRECSEEDCHRLYLKITAVDVFSLMCLLWILYLGIVKLIKLIVSMLTSSPAAAQIIVLSKVTWPTPSVSSAVCVVWETCTAVMLRSFWRRAS